MIPTALACGIDIRSSLPADIASRLPFRKVIELRKPSTYMDNTVYVGSGHHSHRIPTTKWASPFWEGKYRSAEECLVRYVEHLHASGLAKVIDELAGKILLCECPLDKPCVSDILIATFYAHWEENILSMAGVTKAGRPTNRTPIPPAGKMVKRSRNWSPKRLGLLVAGAADMGHALLSPAYSRARYPLGNPISQISRSSRCRWPQEAIIAAFVNMYPKGFFKDFAFPFIEDLINAHPFTTYLEWREKNLEI